MEIRPVKNYNDVKHLRDEYLNSIPESQELFVELMVDAGECFIIEEKRVEVGYAIVFEGEILVEFFLRSKYLTQCESIFQFLIQSLSFKRTYCKSFDAILLKTCMSQYSAFKQIGILFRNYKSIAGLKIGLVSRLAEGKDYALINNIREGLFDSDEEVEQYIQHKSMLVYELDGEFIGCGIFQKINEERNYFDIGMLVNPEKRNQGYGAQIIHSLVTFCHSNSWIPICGCAIDNIASRKTLEKAGFISKYNLIEFS